MSKNITSWPQVFALATQKAKKLREANPNLGVADSTKQAWKDPEVIKAKADYDKYKEANAGKTTGAAKKKPAKKTSKK
jgi:hypothetical protein